MRYVCDAGCGGRKGGPAPARQPRDRAYKTEANKLASLQTRCSFVEDTMYIVFSRRLGFGETRLLSGKSKRYRSDQGVERPWPKRGYRKGHGEGSCPQRFRMHKR